MTELLKIKDALQRLYGKYDTIISHVLKFAAAFVSFMLIRGMTGYNGLASNVFIIILLSAVCAFLPAGVTTMCGCGLIILQLYGLENYSEALKYFKKAYKNFGEKNIKGIIDSNTQLQGGNINGVEIIGIDEYIKHGQNKKIYITSYYQAESIIENLKARKIKNYFK